MIYAEVKQKRMRYFLANFSIGKYRKWIKVDEVFNTKFGNKTATKKNRISALKVNTTLYYLIVDIQNVYRDTKSLYVIKNYILI